ncbi:MAG: DUF362 domain-containing protein [Acidobacteria bacterium]|nr:DUF362 domain-containing protein [Acidobacteriota bacterium]
MHKPAVCLASCKNYAPEELKTALIKIFTDLGGIEKYADKGKKIVLKPNLVMGKSPAAGATTNPEFIRQLAVILKEHGAQLLIAESPGGPYTPARLNAVYNACEITEAAAETGIVLNYKTETVKKENPNGKYLKTIELVKPLAEADFIINLPKPKSHGQMTYTGAVKNMFGAVAGVFKADYHLRMSEYDTFADAIIDVFLCVKPKLTIMDAVVGMDGNGPTGGTPRHIGLICASEDAFALDLTMLEILGLDPQKAPVMKQGMLRNLCASDISEIEIKGENPEEFFIDDFYFPAAGSVNFFHANFLFKPFARFFKPYPGFQGDDCVSCGECARSCPAEIIIMKDGKPSADLSKCVRCFCCQELCPTGAVEIKRSFIHKIFHAIYSVLLPLYNFIFARRPI